MSAGSRLAVLGAGKLGEALLSGLLRAGRPVEDMTVVVRRPERAKELEERYGVQAVPATEAAKADVLLVTVKPQDIEGLVEELAPHVQRSSLVISLAAGIPTAYYAHRLAPGVPVVRVMSNTPVLVDEAMIDAGILLGIPRAVAADLLVQTALGSAVMLRDAGEHPVKLRETVTSPGGTTINAIRELEKHGVRAALLDAIEAARDRSAELGRLYE